MRTVHLDTIGLKSDLKPMVGTQKQKAVWGVVIGFWGGKQKKGVNRKWLIPLSYSGDPNGTRTRVTGVRGQF